MTLGNAGSCPLKPHYPQVLNERDFLRQYLSDPKDLRADLTLDTQSIYIEANEPTLLRRVQDSILNLSPDLLSLTARQQAADADAPELFDKADDSLRLSARRRLPESSKGSSTGCRRSFRQIDAHAL